MDGTDGSSISAEIGKVIERLNISTNISADVYDGGLLK